MLGFLLYLPTLAYIPHASVLLSFIYIAFNYKKTWVNFPINNDVRIIVLIIMLFFINRLLFLENAQDIKDIIPYMIFLLPTYYVAINLTKSTLLVLINFILLESFVVIFEFYFGISTFFTNLPGYQVFDSNALMYFTRPLGLSENSSDIASKLFIAILLIEFLNLKAMRYKIYIVILIFALVLTFNRAAIVALVFFYSIKYILFYFEPILTYKRLFIKLILVIIPIIVFSILIYKFGDTILMQFTRNNGSIELSGRGLIWHNFFIFIQENLLLGNGSYKLFIEYYLGRMAHAHNSFIELLATNGIIIFILYMYIIFKNINWKNSKFVLALFLFSMAQYIIFWGISLEDIILFYFLKINHKKEKLNVG